MKELICIVCPKGCHLKVDEANDFAVTGNSCPRGAEYGKKEMTAPVRMVTSTVRISGALHPRCPVKTSVAVPKATVADVVRTLDAVSLSSPVHVGETVIANVCGTGADIVVTKDM